MIWEYEKFSGKTFDEKKFLEYIKDKDQEQQYARKQGALNIGILGARANDSMKEILEENKANVAFDLTCTGLGKEDPGGRKRDPGWIYQRSVKPVSCMRMEQAANRDELIRRFAGSVDGIIYHTVQFCDNYAYEYAWLKGWLDRPMLLLEQIIPAEQRTDTDQDRSFSGVSGSGNTPGKTNREGR